MRMIGSEVILSTKGSNTDHESSNSNQIICLCGSLGLKSYRDDPWEKAELGDSRVFILDTSFIGGEFSLPRSFRLTNKYHVIT